MSSGPHHYQVAIGVLNRYQEIRSRRGRAIALQAAQVHATLALAAALVDADLDATQKLKRLDRWKDVTS